MVSLENIDPSLLKGRALLVVDDSFVNLHVAQEIFGSFGFSVHEASSGVEAINILKTRSIDCILMDIEMPDMDGFETTLAIRGLSGAKSNTPILAATAHNSQSFLDKIKLAGMQNHIAKPIDANKAVETIINTLGIKLSTTTKTRSDTLYHPDIPPDLYALNGFDIAGALKRLRNNAAMLTTLLLEFTLSHAETESNFFQLIDEGKYSAVRRLAHQLKGSSANLGAVGLSSAAGDIEEYLNNETPPIPEKLLTCLSSAFINLSEAKSLLRTHKQS